MTGKWLSAIVAGWALIAAATAMAQSVTQDLQIGRQRYDNRIKDAATPLKRAWDAPDPKGRTLRVAYMIGSSRCYDGDVMTGRNWLGWMLKRLGPKMSAADANAVETRRRDCESTQWATSDGYFEVSRVWTGELLYLNPDSKALARPIHILDSKRIPFALAPPAPVTDSVAVARRAETVAALITPSADLKKNCRWMGPARQQTIGRYSFISRQVPQALPPDWLAQVSTGLDAYLETLKADYGMVVPDRAITVILAMCADELPEIAGKVHNLAIDPSQNIGYNVKDDLTVVAVLDQWARVPFKPPGADHETDSQLRRTLRHELFHLVAHHSFIDMPTWLDEGLAQYLAVTGLKNIKLPGITVWPDTWPEGPALASVLGSTGDTAAAATDAKVVPLMMQVDLTRMFLAYADEQKRLVPLIAALRSRNPTEFEQPEQSDVAIIEHVLGQTLAEIETQAKSRSLICRFHADAASWQWQADVDPQCRDKDIIGFALPESQK